MPRETAAVSAQVMCTPFNHAPVYSVTSFKAVGRMHVCLAATCLLHFWQSFSPPCTKEIFSTPPPSPSPPPFLHLNWNREYETECTERQDDRRDGRVPSEKQKAKVNLSLATSQRSASVPFTQLQSCVGRLCG